MTAEITQATEQATPAKEKFSDMLNKFLDDTPRFEGGVVKGTVLAIENDAALIDVGLKVEGRVPLKEFAAPGQAAEVKVGDEVEVYIERFETARGEASLSRERARREEAWGKARAGLQGRRAGHRRHLRPGQGRLHGRSRRGRGVPARKPGRYPAGARHRAPGGHGPAVPDPQDGSPPRQYRRLPPCRAGRYPCRAT